MTSRLASRDDAGASDAVRRLTIVNPLGRALAHYNTQVVQTLSRLGAAADPIADYVALDGEAPKLTRARAHLGAVSAARRAPRRALVLWPAFGYLEPALWRGSRELATIVMHDPEAMRRQHGYGPIGRRLGRWGLRGRQVRMVCHTHSAAAAVARTLGITPPSVVLHPIRTADLGAAPDADGTGAADGNAEPVVLVAGQFKPSRDVNLLATLGPQLRRRGYRPRIVGRGWPTIAGWERHDRFLTEEEFLGSIRAAHVVLVPYRAYWQSGVAVQALEQATPAVGYRTEFLQYLHGDSHPGYVNGFAVEEWLAAIERTAFPTDQAAIEASRIAYQTKVDESWQTLTR